MIQPGVLPLVGRRYIPFSYEIDVQGVDLTGAAVTAQVRLYPGAASVAAAFTVTTAVTSTAGLPTTAITLALTEAVMTGMPSADQPGGDVVLAWDLRIAPAAGNAYVLLSGSFTVQTGVTHA